MKITRKTNGYELSERLCNLVNRWTAYLETLDLDIREIKLFYYGDKTVFADVVLDNHNYGSFVASEYSIHFNSHVCTEYERLLFAGATINDPLFKSEILKH